MVKRVLRAVLFGCALFGAGDLFATNGQLKHSFSGYSQSLTPLASHYYDIERAVHELGSAYNACGVYQQLFTQLMLTTYIFVHLRDFQENEFLWEVHSDAVGREPIKPVGRLIFRLGDLAAYITAYDSIIDSEQSIGWILEIALEINSALGLVGFLPRVSDDASVSDGDVIIRKRESVQLNECIDHYLSDRLDELRNASACCELVLNINLRLINKLLTLLSCRPIPVFAERVIEGVSDQLQEFALITTDVVFPGMKKIQEALQHAERSYPLDLAIGGLNNEFEAFFKRYQSAVIQSSEGSSGHGSIPKNCSASFFPEGQMDFIGSNLGVADEFSRHVLQPVDLGMVFKQLVQALYLLGYVHPHRSEEASSAVLHLAKRVVELPEYILNQGDVQVWIGSVVREIQEILLVLKKVKREGLSEEALMLTWVECYARRIKDVSVHCRHMADLNAKMVGQLLRLTHNLPPASMRVQDSLGGMKMMYALPEDKRCIIRWLDTHVLPELAHCGVDIDTVLGQRFDNLVTYIKNPRIESDSSSCSSDVDSNEKESYGPSNDSAELQPRDENRQPVIPVETTPLLQQALLSPRAIDSRTSPSAMKKLGKWFVKKCCCGGDVSP